MLRRLDVVVTTRLHGLVLALKNGVPALAVDPVAAAPGGGPSAGVVVARRPDRARSGAGRAPLGRAGAGPLVGLVPLGRRGRAGPALPPDGSVIGELLDVLGAR